MYFSNDSVSVKPYRERTATWDPGTLRKKLRVTGLKIVSGDQINTFGSCYCQETVFGLSTRGQYTSTTHVSKQMERSFNLKVLD